MANQRGYWKLDTHSVDSDSTEPFEVSDTDLEHIGNLIAQGFTEGEITQDDDKEELFELEIERITGRS